MKKIVLLSCMMFAMLGCRNNDTKTIPEELIETVSIGSARETIVPSSGSELNVALLSVNDSRCPINAICITAGTALLKFKVSDKNNEIDVMVSFSNVKEASNQVDFKLNGTVYRMTVTELLPFTDTSKTPTINDYTVQVGIKKI